jgi:G3E family GTPase
VAVRNIEENVKFESCGKPDEIDSFVIKTVQKLTQENLQRFIKLLPDGLLRLKGFVHLTDHKTIAVQWSMGNLQLNEVQNFEGPTELIAMGFDLNSLEITRKFQELCTNATNK